MNTTTLPLNDNRAFAYVGACADRGAVAFVAVLPDETMAGIQGALGVAVANESGYFPVPLRWARFSSFSDAETEADRLNALIGLDDLAATKIIFSTMGGQRYVAA